MSSRPIEEGQAKVVIKRRSASRDELRQEWEDDPRHIGAPVRKKKLDDAKFAEVGLPQAPSRKRNRASKVQASKPAAPAVQSQPRAKAGPEIGSGMRASPEPLARDSAPSVGSERPAFERPSVPTRAAKAPRISSPPTPGRRPGEIAGRPSAPPPLPDLPESSDLSELAVELPVIGHFGPYDILGRLAMGGMAEILLARNREDAGSAPIVLKKILAQYAQDDEFVEMFLDEAHIGTQLGHSSICRFLDSGEIDNQLFIAMEWVNGVTLGRLIRRARDQGGLEAGMVCALLAKVADALHYAHTARDETGVVMGLVHRDVSPHNIMISYTGQPKLLDFGIAKAEVQAHHTRAGVVKGKFAYMAPEQCRGLEIDYRIDIFALGVVLYEALTGRSLYRRGSEMETMRAIVKGPVPKLSERLERPPRELEAIVSTALAKAPEDRYPTAAAMRDVLRMYAKRSGVPADDISVARVVRKLFLEEMRKGPAVDSTPFGASYDIGKANEIPIPSPKVESAPRPTPDLFGAPELAQMDSRPTERPKGNTSSQASAPAASELEAENPRTLAVDIDTEAFKDDSEVGPTPGQQDATKERKSAPVWVRWLVLLLFLVAAIAAGIAIALEYVAPPAIDSTEERGLGS